MIASRLIPMLWLRLIVIIAFTIFVAIQGLWLIAAIACALFGLTCWQLRTGYRNKAETERDFTSNSQ